MMFTDFAASFLTFRIDTDKKPPATVSHQPPYSLNNARIQLECCCEVTEKVTGRSDRFVLGASCKTERVGVETDIWTKPNADFVPIFSASGFLNLKTYARAGEDVDLYPPGSGKQTDRQTGLNQEVFDSAKIDIVERPGEILKSAREIVEATLANAPLIARIRIESDRYVAVIEHPVKTMNANERDDIFQTDTGPVLYPDLDAEPDDMLSRFELAFSAFNYFDWVEFLVRCKTSVAEDVDVYHYSESVRHDSRNEIIRLL
ncbi:MAG: hypothetical protein ACKVHE_16650 [Planctomycetales bacterium]|jgi:hypothetical protein